MADTVTYWPWYVTLAALGLVLVVPIWLGQSLARRWRMPDYAGKFSFILFTLFAGVVISYYGWSTSHIQLGIDLKGGSYLVYQLLESERREVRDRHGAARRRRPAHGVQRQGRGWTWTSSSPPCAAAWTPAASWG